VSGIGVCCVRSGRVHFATDALFGVECRCVLGGVCTPSAIALHCPSFLGRFGPPVAVAGGICVQGTSATSSATSAARPWRTGRTAAYGATQHVMARTTPVCERRAESRERRAAIWRAESVEEIKIATLIDQKKTFLKTEQNIPTIYQICQK
jgi:hypothetical protein